jgi:small-conductance mechanosensitive channel
MRRRFLHIVAAAFAACWFLAMPVETLAAEASPAEDRAAKPSAASPLAAAQRAAAETRTLLENLDLKALWLENSLTDWVVLLIAIAVGLSAGKVAAAALGFFGRRLEGRGWPARALVVRELAGPASLTLLALGLTVGLAGLRVSPEMHIFRLKVLWLLYTIALFWYAYNLVGLIDVLFGRWVYRRETTLDHQVPSLVRKSLRFFLVIIGLLYTADSVFGQDIGAWLAGLGIAGLAVSLAAQDSLKNLFGSVTILLDRPFRIGEEIRYAGIDGVIEQIGFRSTKVRTGSGSLVNIPNASIVNSPLENLSRRPSIHRSMNLAIPHHTPRAKIEQAVQILRGILDEEGIREPLHQVIEGQQCPPRVYFSELGPESLSLLVNYWYSPPSHWDYMEHAQKLNLRICEEFAKAGIEFAPPPPAR